MYEKIFQRAVFPVLDRLNRTEISKVLAFLGETESYSESELRGLQDRKLSEILNWTREHSGFYRDFWASAGQDRRASSEYPELDGLPVVTKDDLREAASQFPLPAYKGNVLEIRTSGSTGTPMQFLRSQEQESWFWATRMRIWQWAGYELGEPYLALNLNKRAKWSKRAQDLLFRCTYLSYNAENLDSRGVLEALKRSGAVHINAFGSTLHLLARYMRDNSIENPGVRVLTTTGDNLSQEHRKEIEAAFGVPAIDYYGAGGEGAHLASQCTQADRYHLHVENSVVEILRDGRPAKPGEMGSVVFTQLDNRAMPLVRYDVGDLATVSDGEPCPCGRAHPTISGINGRACDVILTPRGGALLPQFFFIGPFKLLDNLRGYQVVQEELDRLVVKLVAEPGCDRAASEEAIRAYISEAAEGSLKIDFDWVDEIPLSGLGKPRPVISKLSAGSQQGSSELGS